MKKLLSKEQEQLFWNTVDADGDCWEWRGFRLKAGYGRFAFSSKKVLAHRMSWQLLVGPIPPGLTIDHLCQNHPCVNPDHLEPVTIQENIARHKGRNGLKTHCPHGHSYSFANTYYDKLGKRYCRICRADKERARRARNKIAACGIADVEIPLEET